MKAGTLIYRLILGCNLLNLTIQLYGTYPTSMKLKLALILLAFIGYGSRSFSQQKNGDPTDTLGLKISNIEYRVKALPEEASDFDNGIVPWVNLENPGKELNRLVDTDEVVLAFAKVTLIIDYPLAKPVSFILESGSKSFSRKELIKAISKKYHEIYAEEEKTTKTEVVPKDKREGLINRNETNGKYGICCHDLSDLDLSSIDVYKNDNGNVYLVLNVES